MINSQQIYPQRCELRSTGEGESACDMLVCVHSASSRSPWARTFGRRTEMRRISHLDRQRLN